MFLLPQAARDATALDIDNEASIVDVSEAVDASVDSPVIATHSSPVDYDNAQTTDIDAISESADYIDAISESADYIDAISESADYIDAITSPSALSVDSERIDEKDSSDDSSDEDYSGRFF